VTPQSNCNCFIDHTVAKQQNSSERYKYWLQLTRPQKDKNRCRNETLYNTIIKYSCKTIINIMKKAKNALHMHGQPWERSIQPKD